MRFSALVAVALLTLFALFARPLAAEESTAVVAGDERLLERHTAGWYTGWGLIVVGGAASLTGTALTTQTDTDNGMPQPGLSAPATAGWVMVSVGTATWIAGALVLKLTPSHARR
jgi:hypothetical protein